MKKLIYKAFQGVTGKTVEQMAREFNFHYFLTRSKAKSYWRVLVG